MNRFIQRFLGAFRQEAQGVCAESLDLAYAYLQVYLCAVSNDTACAFIRTTSTTPAPTGQYSGGRHYI